MPTVTTFSIRRNNGQILLTVNSDDPRRLQPLFAIFDDTNNLWDFLHTCKWRSNADRICNEDNRSLSSIISEFYFGLQKKRSVDNDDYTEANYNSIVTRNASKQSKPRKVLPMFLLRHAKQKYRRISDHIELPIIDATTSDIVYIKFNKQHAHLVPKYAYINAQDGVICKAEDGSSHPLYKSIIAYNEAMLGVALNNRRPNFKANDYTVREDGTWTTATIIRSQVFTELDSERTLMRVQQRAGGMATDDVKWRIVKDGYRYYYIVIPTQHVEHLSEFNWMVLETDGKLSIMASRDGTMYKLPRVVASLVGLNIDAAFIQGGISAGYKAAMEGNDKKHKKARARFESRELSSPLNRGRGRVFKKDIIKSRSNTKTDVIRVVHGYSDDIAGNEVSALFVLKDTIHVS